MPLAIYEYVDRECMLTGNAKIAKAFLENENWFGDTAKKPNPFTYRPH